MTTLAVVVVIVSLLVPTFHFGIMGAGLRSIALAGVGAVLAVFYLLRALALDGKWRVEGIGLVIGAVTAIMLGSAVVHGPFRPTSEHYPVIDTILRMAEANDVGIDEAVRMLPPEQEREWNQALRDSASRVLRSLNWSSAMTLGVVSFYLGVVAATSVEYERTLVRTMQSRVVCIGSCLSFLLGVVIIGAKVVLAQAALAAPDLLGSADTLVKVFLASPLLNDAAPIHESVMAEGDVRGWSRRITSVSVFELALVFQALCYFTMDRWVDTMAHPVAEDGAKRPLAARVLIGMFAGANAFASTLLVRKVVYIFLYFPGGLHLTL